ncbi:cobalamin biosynthesis protein CobW [Marinibaculum pumilum]|uniref:Cobalamin biosynthesis protein CobW n=1 Tax=Marinibaculum pumilum TaxID=1766165 RepID=A0ABV7L884_9PROT
MQTGTDGKAMPGGVRPGHGKIGATVVTGFLGAGKTTLIRNLIATAGGRRIALIINEFGDLGVDGEILKGCGDLGCPEEDVVELANGCICCTVADDFLPTMKMLLARDPAPEHIVIETSGLALPKPLVKAFAWPEIRTRVTVDGVVTLVDAAAMAEGRFAADEEAVAAQRGADPALDHDSPLEELFEDQLACADLVIVNKTDLVDVAKLEELRAELSGRLRTGVRMLTVANGAIDAAHLLGLEAAAEADLAARPSHHDDEPDHDHDDFESFVVTGPAIADPAPLDAALAGVLARHGILRLKGFAAVAGKPMRLVVQAVGPRVQHHFDRPWNAAERSAAADRASRLVVIGETGLDRDAIAADLQAVLAACGAEAAAAAAG